MLKTTREARLQKRFFERASQPLDPQPPRRPHQVAARPDCGEDLYVGSGKLVGQVAIITGGDSGVGRAAAIAFAREGANVSVVYRDAHADARDTASWVESAERQCLLQAGDAGDDGFFRHAVDETLQTFGRIDIVVNNAAEHAGDLQSSDDPAEITRAQVEQAFRARVLSCFSLTGAALKHMRDGGKIINVTSALAYTGHDRLIAYSAAMGAIVTYTRSLALALMKRRIRVNAIAPGPLWTPVAPACPSEPAHAMGRAAQPVEIAPAFVYLASTDSTFMTGQVLHPNGGTIVGA